MRKGVRRSVFGGDLLPIHSELRIEIGLNNQRGVTVRYMGEGGKQERELAAEYQHQVDKIKYVWPRTSAMLRRIAESYRRDVNREDLEVELQNWS